MEKDEIISKYLPKFEELAKDSDDPESAHLEADDLLCELLTVLGYEVIVDIYNDIGKWYA